MIDVKQLYERGEYRGVIDALSQRRRTNSETVLLFAAAIASGSEQDLQGLAESVDPSGDDPPELKLNAAIVLHRLGDDDLSVRLFEAATESRQDLLNVWGGNLRHKTKGELSYANRRWELERDVNCGTVVAADLRRRREYGQARNILLDILRLPDVSAEQQASALSSLASIEKDCGRVTTAVGLYRDSISIRGLENTARHSNMLMSMNYDIECDMSAYLRDCRSWSDLHDYPAAKFSPRPSGRSQLRVGLIGGDFCGSALGSLMLPAVRHLREVSGYHFRIYQTRDIADKVAGAFAGAVDAYERVDNIRPLEAAQKIYDHDLDILVDTAGHSGYNGLTIMRHRPAFTQLSWLSGMMCPNEVDCCEAYLGPAAGVPEGYTGDQRVVGLQEAFSYIYDPAIPSVRRLGRFKQGDYPTFGSFNNACKINDDVLAAWREILEQVPEGRLVVKVYDTDHGVYIRRKMGQAADRLEIIEHLPTRLDVKRFYAEKIDLALDTWPCGGCLTTIEALECGTPTLTLRGPTFSHMQSHAVLFSHGLEGLLSAGTVAEYVERARYLASDGHDILAEMSDNGGNAVRQVRDRSGGAVVAAALIQSLTELHHRNCDNYRKQIKELFDEVH